jgi:hypothetical protein
MPTPPIPLDRQLTIPEQLEAVEAYAQENPLLVSEALKHKQPFRTNVDADLH